MAQELIYKSIGIVGAGPAGCMCAKLLSDAGFDVTLFDMGKFLRTLLPTGGGKCNITHDEPDFREFAKNYPRGEKFLYSVFSKFGVSDTIDFFNSIGVKTYTREDKRVFPISNSSSDVREKLLKSIKCHFTNEEVVNIQKISGENGFKLKTDKNEYYFDDIVISIGGHAGYKLLENLGINIITPVPSLVGFVTKENFSSLSGVSLKDVKIKIKKKEYCGDILFTHKGISGPLIYVISSVYAKEKLPLEMLLRFTEDIDLQKFLEQNSHKEVKNLLSQFVPKSLGEYILKISAINPDTPCHQINSKQRNKICESLTNFKVTVINKVKDSEIVTCGGVDLKEVNSKTLESKKYDGLYFCGEVLDIDGFCGGYNLQNCWSTGYICAQSIINK
ncbi:MAG: NAD(P)/FAD-dependent oxidoreductase [Cyanobacteriota bacterium]|nr:NAD(P)/FAD-dependent oxidoreductase [Cyanobacteriota bacterium]